MLIYRVATSLLIIPYAPQETSLPIVKSARNFAIKSAHTWIDADSNTDGNLNFLMLV